MCHTQQAACTPALVLPPWHHSCLPSSHRLCCFWLPSLPVHACDCTLLRRRASGPCTPPVGPAVLCREIQSHISEPFWHLHCTLRTPDSKSCEFQWERGRLFDHTAAVILYEMCMEDPTATVLKVSHASSGVVGQGEVAGSLPDQMQQQPAVPEFTCSLLLSQPKCQPEARPSCEAVINAGRPSWLPIA